MPIVPTIYGLPIEHSERSLRAAEKELSTYVDRLRPGYRKAQHALVRIGRLWSGADGTKAMRGIRVPPTQDAVRRVASLVHDQRPAVRAQALDELGWAVALVPLVLDEILIALDDAEGLVRERAAVLLARVDAAVPDTAIPQLRARLSDPRTFVRWTVVPVLVGRVAPAILVGVMLETVPAGNARQEDVHAWLRAANAILPATLELAEKIRELETRL